MRKFTAAEVKEHVYDNAVETTEYDVRRWYRVNLTIVELDGKFYQLYWNEGLTECQENEFEAQEAQEVEKIKETVVIEKWVGKGD